MAEYIDRSVAIARITALEVTEPSATMAAVKRVLVDMPAADVARVVRCKDCKYWADEHGKAQRADGVLYARCRIHNHRVGDQNVGLVPTEDDFCRYGERKEEAND